MESTKISGSERDELIISFLSGNSTSSEDDQLLDWTNQSEENSVYFQKMQKTWLGSNRGSGIAAVNVDKALLKIHQSAGVKTRAFSKKSYGLISRISGLAAAFLLVFLLGGLVSKYLLNIEADDSSVSSIYVPKGSKAMAVLPDGSEVWLNAGSNLSYHNSSYFKKNREVRLTGEAYFKVITDRDKPFVVKAKGLDITALGTEFNVKAYPEEKLLETTLVKGIVKIQGKDKDDKDLNITLVPRQKVLCYTEGGSMVSTEQVAQLLSTDEDPANPAGNVHPPEKVSKAVISSNVKTDMYTSWRNNQWIIEGMDIGQLAVLIERKYDVKIDFKSEELKAYRFTGTFQNETLEQVMQVLKLTVPMTYEIGKGKVELMLDPMLKDRYEELLEG